MKPKGKASIIWAIIAVIEALAIYILLNPVEYYVHYDPESNMTYVVLGNYNNITRIENSVIFGNRFTLDSLEDKIVISDLFVSVPSVPGVRARIDLASFAVGCTESDPCPAYVVGDTLNIETKPDDNRRDLK